MNTRRKFLLKGSMATTALLTAKPFKTIANTLAPLTGYSINDNKVILAHTGNYGGIAEQTVRQITALKNNTGNLLLLHAGDTVNENAAHLKYDALIQQGDPVSLSVNDYNIVYKGNIKIGIITATANEADTISRMNTISGYLKKEKDCQLVVCLSQLGFRSNNNLDDLSLAKNSTHIDIIIGGHDSNFCKQPVIAFNKNREEVIINHSAEHELAFRKIEIEFDKLGKKNKIGFTRTVQSSQVS